MYGKSCVAVTFRDPSDEADLLFQLGGLVQEMADYGDSRAADAIYKFIKSRRVDSMGLGVVVYFPAAGCPDDDADPDDDEGGE